MTTITIDLNDEMTSELRYLVELHQRHGAPNPMPSVEALIEYVLCSVANGSRRPGSWERQMLESMGLVAEANEHQQYRPAYGPPAPESAE